MGVPHKMGSGNKAESLGVLTVTACGTLVCSSMEAQQAALTQTLGPITTFFASVGKESWNMLWETLGWHVPFPGE